MDGINIDFEDSISLNRTDLRDALTSLINESYTAFKEVDTSYQVSSMLRSNYYHIVIFML